MLKAIRCLSILIVLYSLVCLPPLRHAQVPIPISFLPSLSQTVQNNRFAVLLVLYLGYLLVFNSFSMDVFDIYCDGQLLFSKQHSYRFPTDDVALSLSAKL